MLTSLISCHSKAFGLIFLTWKMESIFQWMRLHSVACKNMLKISSSRARRWWLYSLLVYKMPPRVTHTFLWPNNLKPCFTLWTRLIYTKHHWSTIRPCSLTGSLIAWMKLGILDSKSYMRRSHLMEYGFLTMSLPQLVTAALMALSPPSLKHQPRKLEMPPKVTKVQEEMVHWVCRRGDFKTSS